MRDRTAFTFAAGIRLSASRAQTSLPTLGKPSCEEPGLNVPNRSTRLCGPCASSPPLPAPQSGLFSAVYIQDHTHVQNRIWCRCDAGHLKAWITLMFFDYKSLIVLNGYKWLYLLVAVSTHFNLFNQTAEAFFTPHSLKRKSRDRGLQFAFRTFYSFGCDSVRAPNRSID